MPSGKTNVRIAPKRMTPKVAAIWPRYGDAKDSTRRRRPPRVSLVATPVTIKPPPRTPPPLSPARPSSRHLDGAVKRLTRQGLPYGCRQDIVEHQQPRHLRVEESVEERSDTCASVPVVA